MEDSDDVGSREYDPQLEGELVGVGAVWQLALAGGGAGFGGEQVAPLLASGSGSLPELGWITAELRPAGE